MEKECYTCGIPVDERELDKLGRCPDCRAFDKRKAEEEEDDHAQRSDVH